MVRPVSLNFQARSKTIPCGRLELRDSLDQSRIYKSTPGQPSEERVESNVQFPLKAAAECDEPMKRREHRFPNNYARHLRQQRKFAVG